MSAEPQASGMPSTGDAAANADEFLKPWTALEPASVVVLHTRDRKTADDPAFVKPLTEATGVWFGGGSQDRVTAGSHFRQGYARRDACGQ